MDRWWRQPCSLGLPCCELLHRNIDVLLRYKDEQKTSIKTLEIGSRQNSSAQKKQDICTVLRILCSLTEENCVTLRLFSMLCFNPSRKT